VDFDKPVDPRSRWRSDGGVPRGCTCALLVVGLAGCGASHATSSVADASVEAEASSPEDASAEGEGGAPGPIQCTVNADTQCGCTATGPANDTPCTPQQVRQPAGCCADEDWPAAGAGCFCDSFGCSSAGQGCDCAFFGGDVASCTAAVCCSLATTVTGDCQCVQTAACPTGYTTVSACTVDTVPCATGKKRVAGCAGDAG
jgi:hypothetical protein